MKNIVNITVLTLIIFLTLPASANLYAQEWSLDQKDVWENVETYNGLFANGDIEEFLTYLHEDFSGWRHNSDMPDDKKSREKKIRYGMTKTRVIYYELRPVSIQIHGNVAVVHYYYKNITKGTGREETVERGRWTDIVIRQGTKWVMIADHGGSIDSN